MNENSGMTAYRLKMIALITMFIDHCGAVVLERVLSINHIIISFDSLEAFQRMGTTGLLYVFLRSIGRLSFPIYLFLMVDGLEHTRSIKKYILNMFIFAFISEIPFDMALNLSDKEVFSGKLFSLGYQNVFFTLTISLAMMTALRECEKRIDNLYTRYIASLTVIAAGAAVCWLLKTDYSYAGAIAAGVLYMFRYERKTAFAMAVLALTLLSSYLELFAFIALPFVAVYNGERGKKINKYIFYAFYPAHFLLLWGVCIFEGLLK